MTLDSICIIGLAIAVILNGIKVNKLYTRIKYLEERNDLIRSRVGW